MQTNISVDVSSSLTREPVEEVAARDPDSPQGTGRLPDRIRKVRARNLPVEFDLLDAERDEIIPFRTLDAPAVGGLDVDPGDVLISTTGTSATSLRLLVQGESERQPSGREPMQAVRDPEPVTDGGTGGVLIGLSNEMLVGGIAGGALALALAGIASDSRSVALGVGIGAVGVSLGVGAGAVGAFDA